MRGTDDLIFQGKMKTLFNQTSKRKKISEYLDEMLSNNYKKIEFPDLSLNCLTDYQNRYSNGKKKYFYEPDDIDEIIESDLIFFLKNESPKKFLYYTIRAIQSEYFLGPKIIRLLFEILMSLQSTYNEPLSPEEVIFKVISILELTYSKYNTCDITCRDDYIDCLSRKCEIVTGLPLKCSLAPNFIELLFMLINDTLQMDGTFEEKNIKDDVNDNELSDIEKKINSSQTTDFDDTKTFKVDEKSCSITEENVMNKNVRFDNFNEMEIEEGKAYIDFQQKYNFIMIFIPMWISP